MRGQMAANERDPSFGEGPDEIFRFTRLHLNKTGRSAVVHLHSGHGLHFLFVLILGFGIPDERFVVDGGLVN